jgi:hypothetical protein
LIQPTAGHVYILTSPNCEHVKIGGTDFPPMKRIREINAALPYGELGPWGLYDFRQVADWRKVEAFLHNAFRSHLVTKTPGQKELFGIAPQRVAAYLDEIDPAQIVSKPKVDRLFQDAVFSEFLLTFFRFTGLMNWLHLQGSWVFVLFPSTSGGRYFTLNIGRHEVAFCALPRGDASDFTHMMIMDRLIYDFPDVIAWVEARGGRLVEDNYASALPRAVSIMFDASFSDGLRFLGMQGVRRALIAYWGEALIRLDESNSLSFFARHHNWNAIAEIRRRLSTRKS